MEEVKVKMSVLDDGVELPRPHGWRNRRAHHGGALGRPRRRLERARASVVAAALVIAVDTFVVLTDKAEEKKVTFFNLQQQRGSFSDRSIRSMVTFPVIE